MVDGHGRGTLHRLRPLRGSLQRENDVPEGHFRTWIERYVITKPKPGSGESRGETMVDSPNGGIGGFKPSPHTQGGHSQIIFCSQAVQPLRALALHAGLPGRRHLRRAGRRGAGGQELLHRLRFLHPGLSRTDAAFLMRKPTPPTNARCAITGSRAVSSRPAWRFARRRPGFSAI